MKKTILFLVTVLISSITTAQTINLPLTRGGEFSGGTILKVNTSNGSYEATPMVGKIGNSTEGAENNGVVTTANSGIYHETSNNSLYITVKEGDQRVGSSQGAGLIYRYDISSGETHMIHEFGFDDSKGAYPFGELQKIGTKLYGVTHQGGAHGFGTIYSIDPSTDAYTVLFSFNGTTDGGKPSCPLIVDGNVLYGAGGYANGVSGEAFFKYDVSNDTYTTLHLGAGKPTSIKGLYKRDSENKLYISQGNSILTLNLASPSSGTDVFYLGEGANASGFGRSPHEFTFHAGSGSLLTTFDSEGPSGHGGIAKINFGNPSNPIIIFKNFSGGTNGGGTSTKMTEARFGGVVGLAPQGTGDDYVLYEYSGSGGYTILHSFTAQNDGLTVRAGTVYVGDKIYGIAESKGQYGGGTIWSYNFNGGVFTVEAQLGYENGRSPVSGLVMNPTTNELDFTVHQNGSSSRGALNSYDKSNNSYTGVTSFSDINIKGVNHKPFFYNGKTYVMAQLNSGTIATYNAAFGIVEIDITTGDIIGNITPIAPDANVANLNNSIVQGNIIQENNMLYGGTVGLLFSFDLATMTYSTLHTFNGASDGTSTSNITMSGDTIYGINEEDGANSFGTVYSYNTTNNVFAVLEDIPANKIYLGLVRVGDHLFTVVNETASNTMQSMDLNAGTTAFSSLATISSATIGNNPSTTLQEENGIIYGIMNGGGANDLGGLFKFDPSTDAISQLLDFDATTGFYSFNSEMLFSSDPLSVNDFDLDKAISIYPNPSNGLYTISTSNVLEYSIYNSIGALIVTKKGMNQLDITNFSSGLYIVKIKTPAGKTVKRILKN